MAHILVVEEEARLARLMKRVLEEEGHVVDLARGRRHGGTRTRRLSMWSVAHGRIRRIASGEDGRPLDEIALSSAEFGARSTPHCETSRARAGSRPRPPSFLR